MILVSRSIVQVYVFPPLADDLSSPQRGVKLAEDYPLEMLRGAKMVQDASDREELLRALLALLIAASHSRARRCALGAWSRASSHRSHRSARKRYKPSGGVPERSVPSACIALRRHGDAHGQRRVQQRGEGCRDHARRERGGAAMIESRLFSLWDSLVGSAAPVAFIVLGLCVMMRVVNLGDVARHIGVVVGVVILLVTLPPIIVSLWSSMTLGQHLGIAFFVILI